jgi:hypothetical protein
MIFKRIVEKGCGMLWAAQVCLRTGTKRWSLRNNAANLQISLNDGNSVSADAILSVLFVCYYSLCNIHSQSCSSSRMYSKFLSTLGAAGPVLHTGTAGRGHKFLFLSSMSIMQCGLRQKGTIFHAHVTETDNLCDAPCEPGPCGLSSMN